MKSKVEKYCDAMAKLKTLTDEGKEALMADLIGSYIYKSKCHSLDLLLENKLLQFALHVKEMNKVGAQILEVMKDVKANETR